MSFPRATLAVPRTASAFSRFAAAPRRCPQCFRTFASSMQNRQSSKRQMQTATAYQPSSLYPPTPPRNADVPETSIAGAKPGPSREVSSQSLDERPAKSEKEKAVFSMTEEQAQKTQEAPAKGLRPRRYKFGARKAIIKLSPSAVAHLKDLLNQPEPKYIRIGTTAKGCSGLAYKLEYVDKPSMLDERVEQDGVTVLIDNKALLNIIGSEMDWLEDKLNQRFIFKNPNITEQCGCGESFSVS